MGRVFSFDGPHYIVAAIGYPELNQSIDSVFTLIRVQRVDFDYRNLTRG